MAADERQECGVHEERSEGQYAGRDSGTDGGGEQSRGGQSRGYFDCTGDAGGGSGPGAGRAGERAVWEVQGCGSGAGIGLGSASEGQEMAGFEDRLTALEAVVE